MRRAVAKEPVERIRRSPAAPQGAFGAVDQSGEIFADAAKKAAAQFEAVAKRRQEDWDKAKVNEAVSRYLKWDQETRFDPQKGLMFTDRREREWPLRQVARYLRESGGDDGGRA